MIALFRRALASIICFTAMPILIAFFAVIYHFSNLADAIDLVENWLEE